MNFGAFDFELGGVLHFGREVFKNYMNEFEFYSVIKCFCACMELISRFLLIECFIIDFKRVGLN